MRIGDHLYFAPGIEFSDVDIHGPGLSKQVACRIKGFYFEPAHLLVDAGHAFASGVMTVVAIDALARLQTGKSDVGVRFRNWCTNYLPSCKSGNSKRLYDTFRNGLVHEARIKKGCEFSLEIHKTFKKTGDVLSCNPLLLLEEVEAAFDGYLQTLETCTANLEALRCRILADFNYELNN